jgi:hypothetical protein
MPTNDLRKVSLYNAEIEVSSLVITGSENPAAVAILDFPHGKESSNG